MDGSAFLVSPFLLERASGGHEVRARRLGLSCAGLGAALQGLDDVFPLHRAGPAQTNSVGLAMAIITIMKESAVVLTPRVNEQNPKYNDKTCVRSSIHRRHHWGFPLNTGRKLSRWS